MVEPRHTSLDQRLPAIRVRDVILATLQAAFARSDLIGERENPYLFVREDPGASRVWITSPEGREQYTERDGKRLLITVSRGSYTPQELHQHNFSSMSFASGREDFRDLGVTPIMISCEAGSEIGSEVLASMCYHILKLFRRQIMEEYDITNMHFHEIAPASLLEQAPGKVWMCMVGLRVEIEEHARMLEISNRMNRLEVDAHLTQNLEQTIASLDSTPTL